MKKREAGFSMIELMIVCVVMVIIAGIAIPNIFRTYQNYQLDSAGHSVASLLQQARMQAVKTNLPVYVSYSSGSPHLVTITDSSGNAGGDVAISTAVSLQPPSTATGFTSQLDAYLTTTPQVGDTSGTIGFNARGLPCTGSLLNPAVCPASTTGFEWFMRSSAGWEAITVSVSGRVKSWRINNQSGSTTWQ
jgi:prepilin-type N-terminal cleavage/methylation domain-containing protein